MSSGPPRDRPPPRSSLHTIIAVAVFFALGLFVDEKYLSNGPHPAPPVTPRVVPSVGPNDDEIYTGSILFTPRQGRICRQFLFDNRTGRFSDNGNVDCERAENNGASPTDRLSAISKGFH
jgi:hypothetical protein